MHVPSTVYFTSWSQKLIDEMARQMPWYQSRGGPKVDPPVGSCRAVVTGLVNCDHNDLVLAVHRVHLPSILSLVDIVDPVTQREAILEHGYVGRVRASDGRSIAIVTDVRGVMTVMPGTIQMGHAITPLFLYATGPNPIDRIESSHALLEGVVPSLSYLDRTTTVVTGYYVDDLNTTPWGRGDDVKSTPASP